MLDIFKKIIDYFTSKLLPGNTLYYPGCLSKLVDPRIEGNYQNILKGLSIKFISISEFNCCGSPVIRAGYKKDFEELKKKNLEIFEKYGVTRIITNCPGCYNIFRTYYPGLKVEHITQVLNNNINRIQTTNKGKITYHDPCHLGRYSGIYYEPRHILGKLGFEVVELEQSRDKAWCCGAGGGFKSNYPEIANKAAKQILAGVKTTDLVTTCPMCYLHFNENKPKGVNVFEISQFLVKAIKGNKK